MSKMNALLNQRLKKGDQSSKMAALAKQSANGNLTGFSGIFSVVDLSEKEKGSLESILNTYANEGHSLKDDLETLISLTSEVKAINNQAAILHGERIKKAHAILTRYRDGAFTMWLLTAYGNRQTPYNFLQYYEFYEAMPKDLRPLIETMPRQAIYTLASREGALSTKQQIVENFKGQTKQELLLQIREIFPLNTKDKRRTNIGLGIVQELKKIQYLLSKDQESLSAMHKRTILDLLTKINLTLSS